MNPSELFEAGQLQAAIDSQIQEVRSRPADMAARLFLFELLLYIGDIDRARKQIDVLNYENPKAQAAVQMYKFALDAEQKRRRVLDGKETPKSLTAAPEHVMDRLEALKKYAAGDLAAGDQLLDQANAAMPSIKATVNGNVVEGLRDADDLFGTVLEVFGSGGAYCWVALEQVESITMNPPRTPRDVLLIPANITLRDGPSGDVVLPALYAGSYASRDDALRLGRATDWAGDESRPIRGIGGKLFLLGEAGTSPLLHWREVTIHADATA